MPEFTNRYINILEYDTLIQQSYFNARQAVISLEVELELQVGSTDENSS